ncbi:hypothetical protein SynA1562_00259 [Synechococcus sp. A15-62]|nr:hypothetical protein SynA1562_00259 [Synechococcus sp. A15-62]
MARGMQSALTVGSMQGRISRVRLRDQRALRQHISTVRHL